MKCWGQKDKHHVLGQVYSWRSTRPSLYLPIFKSLAFTIFYHYLLSYTIRIFLITNHQPLFHICITLFVESAPVFIPSTSFCSLSSWFTSSCAYHLSQSPPSLSSPITASTFHSRLKTHLFLSGLTSWILTFAELKGHCFVCFSFWLCVLD